MGRALFGILVILLTHESPVLMRWANSKHMMSVTVLGWGWGSAVKQWNSVRRGGESRGDGKPLGRLLDSTSALTRSKSGCE